jgi:hypothetical protein
VRDLAVLRGDGSAELAESLTVNAERVFGFAGSPALVPPGTVERR